MEPERPPNVTPTRVLFVDDDELVSRSVVRALRRLGFDVTAYLDPAEALMAARRHRFDVIVTDQNMPGMTGAMMIEALLADDPTLASRVIISSGDHDDNQSLRKLGCRTLHKPYQAAELALAIRTIAGQRTETPA